VDFIMRLLQIYAENELPNLQRNGIRLQIIGRSEDLPAETLNALNYGSQAEIIDGIKGILSEQGLNPPAAQDVNEALLAEHLYCPSCPDIEMIIRTAGE
jgi:undecaprenyl diphosphate synthase